MDLKMKILIVDDITSMRRIVFDSLSQIGFNNIVEAKDGESALKTLKLNKIDLVLCDWNMPKMSGLELLKAVRNDEKLKNIPFIMITAEGKKENVLDAVKAGVNNYIIKPFNTESLKIKITSVFGE
jgi:two-component system chemotaxis response regulator CheY